MARALLCVGLARSVTGLTGKTPSAQAAPTGLSLPTLCKGIQNRPQYGKSLGGVSTEKWPSDQSLFMPSWNDARKQIRLRHDQQAHQNCQHQAVPEDKPQDRSLLIVLLRRHRR